MFGGPWEDDGQTIKNMENSQTVSPQIGKNKKKETTPLGASGVFFIFVFLPWISLRNKSSIPPLNIEIIPRKILGHTVIIIKAVSHL